MDRSSELRWAVVAWLVVMLTAGCPGPRDYAHQRSGLGLRAFRPYIYELQLAEPGWRSFARFHDYVRQKKPDWVGASDLQNPFPGVLPGCQYARVLHLPEGLNRAQVPLMWDTAPDPGGHLVVLFWDGTVSCAGEVTERSLQSLLDAARERNGGSPLQVSSGECARVPVDEAVQGRRVGCPASP
jgi:hypothetical protein